MTIKSLSYSYILPAHYLYMYLLNQARAWFLRIDPVRIVGMRVRVCARARVCVCPHPRLFITSGVIWTPYHWLNKFYSFIWQL